MSELARINLKGPVYDPRSGVDGGSNKNMSDKIRQGRQDALNNSVQKAKLAHMKFQMKQETDMQKSQEFLAENATDIFNTKADALDSSTWKFTQPGAREEFYKKWKSEVGGNWAGFQAAYGAAKQAEMQAMQKNLMVGRHALNPDGTKKFKNDKQYQKHFSKMLDALPPEQRAQLLSQSSPEMYSQIQSMYLSKDDRELNINPFDSDSDWYNWVNTPERELGVKVAGGVAALGGAAMLVRRGKLKQAEKLVKKGISGSGGSGGMNRQISANAGDVKLLGAGNPARTIPGSGLPVVSGLNAMNKVPANKVPLLLNDIKAKVKTGSLTAKEGSWMQAQLRKMCANGGELDMTEVNGIFQQSKMGRGLLEKAGGWGGALGGIAWIGAGAAAGEQAGSAFGEKAGEIGAIGGAHLVPGMYKTVKSAVDKKGGKWVMNKIMSKAGPGLIARTIGKAGLGSISGLFSGGVGALLTAGWLAADVAMIYKIIQESEEAGEF